MFDVLLPFPFSPLLGVFAPHSVLFLVDCLVHALAPWLFQMGLNSEASKTPSLTTNQH